MGWEEIGRARRRRVVNLTKLKGGPLKRSIIKLINLQPPELSKKGKI